MRARTIAGAAARLEAEVMQRSAPHRRLRWSVRRGEEPAAVAFDPHELSGLFSPPRWLRDLGTTAWLGVGVTLLLVGAVWLLSLTQTIVMPVIAAAVIAAVSSPVVGWLERRGVPRGLGTGLLLVALILIALGVILATLAGITSQLAGLGRELDAARSQIASWLQDLGVSAHAAHSATGEVSQTIGRAVPALLHGLVGGLLSLSSLVVFLSLTALSLFFLLKDGRTIRAWTERHMRVPDHAAHQMTGRVLQSLRGYFVGVTIVAAFNAVVVTLGGLLLGVPKLGAIAIVTFLGAYVPYLGAWGAGAFAVLVALGGAGTDAAIGMAIVQLLANGILQQLVQPIAYGAALGIHPLAVLIVTIAGGALFGAVGLILAAPLTSAATRIASDLARSAAPPGAAHGPGPPAATPNGLAAEASP
jgi:putative heme transporter